MKQLFAGFILVLCFTGCQKVMDVITDSKSAPLTADGYREYLIPPGEHNAKGNVFAVVNKPSTRFRVVFDSSCIYTSQEAVNQQDINKLYGFSDCAQDHHTSSARFGWLWNGHALELYAYCYVNTERKSLFLDTLTIGRPYELSITAQSGQYQFQWPGGLVSMPRSCDTAAVQGYRLYPYFGGDETAPHEIRILIKELE